MISKSSKDKVERKCPKCGGIDIARSPRAGLLHRIYSLVNLYPYHCQHHTCKHRFEASGRK